MKKTFLIAVLLLAVCLTACTTRGSAPAGAEPPKTDAPVPTAEAPAATEVPAATEAPDAAASEGEADVPEEQEEDVNHPLKYDPEAFRAAVDAVLAEYAALDMSDPAAFDEAAHPELPWYTAIIANTERNDLFYGLYDLDGNEIPELVIAAGDESWQQPMGLYAFDGEKMVYLCKDQALGERAQLMRLPDGTFAVRASGGAAMGSVTLWRIAPDGYDTEIIDIVDYEYQDANTAVCTSRLTGKAVEGFQPGDYTESFDAPVEYTLFAQRKSAPVIGMPNPWSQAESAQAAALGAGLTGFTVPEYYGCFSEDPVLDFRYMAGLAQATAHGDKGVLEIRKGLGTEDVSGDYTAYPANWDIVWKGLTIHCSGPAKGQVVLARWSAGKNVWSMRYTDANGGAVFLEEGEVTSLVNQIQ